MEMGALHYCIVREVLHSNQLISNKALNFRINGIYNLLHLSSSMCILSNH